MSGERFVFLFTYTGCHFTHHIIYSVSILRGCLLISFGYYVKLSAVIIFSVRLKIVVYHGMFFGEVYEIMQFMPNIDLNEKEEKETRNRTGIVRTIHSLEYVTIHEFQLF